MILKLIDVSLQVPEKILIDKSSIEISFDRLQLAGRNGVGKSTLLHSIYMGSYQGSITLDGMELNDQRKNSKMISYVPQDKEFVEQSSVKYNFKVHDIDPQKALEFVSKFDSSILLTNNISKLSGGQRQIINIAIGFLKTSVLLILDEPFNNLSVKNRMILEEMMNLETRPIVYVSHLNPNIRSEVIVIEKRGIVWQK